jgi:CHASE3 domain sensor protein
MTADNGLGNRTWAELRRSAPWRTIALLLIVVLATCLFFFGIANQVRDEEESAVALQALRAEIATAQSSVRGYTLVGRPRFLEPYRAAVPAVDRALDDVGSAMSDDNRERVESVARTFGEWRRRFAEPTIAFVRNDRTEEAEALARTGQGKRRIDRIRLLLADEIAEEREEAKESERVETFLGAVAIAAIAALCLAIGLAWQIPRRQEPFSPGEPGAHGASARPTSGRDAEAGSRAGSNNGYPRTPERP